MKRQDLVAELVPEKAGQTLQPGESLLTHGTNLGEEMLAPSFLRSQFESLVELLARGPILDGGEENAQCYPGHQVGVRRDGVIMKLAPN